MAVTEFPLTLCTVNSSCIFKSAFPHTDTTKLVIFFCTMGRWHLSGGANCLTVMTRTLFIAFC